MSFNDPIAELLTKIRNAKDAQHRFVDMNLSKMRVKILNLLKNHGFIDNYLVDEKRHKMRIFLRYTKERGSVILGLKRESKCGCRRYLGYQEIPRVFNGMGIAIMSTSQGVMDGESARKLKVGGEFLCTVW